MLPDYPHEEVSCPGLNHFPDGVFQSCRTVTRQAAEIEKELYRKTQRKQRKYRSRAAGGRGTVIPVAREDNEFDGDNMSVVSLATTDDTSLGGWEESKGILTPSQKRNATIQNSPIGRRKNKDGASVGAATISWT